MLCMKLQKLYFKCGLTTGTCLQSCFEILNPMMIMCLFSRDVFMEKHWRSVINKSICDYFFEAQSKVRHVYTLDTPCSVCVCLYMCFLNHTGDSWWLKISLSKCTPAWRVDLTRLCFPKLFRVVNSWEKHSCRQIFVFILFYHTFVSVKLYYFFSGI